MTCTQQEDLLQPLGEAHSPRRTGWGGAVGTAGGLGRHPPRAPSPAKTGPTRGSLPAASSEADGARAQGKGGQEQRGLHMVSGHLWQEAARTGGGRKGRCSAPKVQDALQAHPLDQSPQAQLPAQECFRHEETRGPLLIPCVHGTGKTRPLKGCASARTGSQGAKGLCVRLWGMKEL